MPWDPIRLNNGEYIPSIAFGTWRLGTGEQSRTTVDQATGIRAGFNHIDTAQSYENEVEAGLAIAHSGLPREDIYVTTKYSRSNGLDIETSVMESCKKLGVSYIDLYLIHNPSKAVPDIPSAWAQMEAVQCAGLARSIGVSNFDTEQLQIVLSSAKIKPVVNQIMFHAYILDKQSPIVEYGEENGIVTEGYSTLLPLTYLAGGPVDVIATRIAARLHVQAEEVLLAWAKAKGVVVVTSSAKRERMERYVAAGNLRLTQEDVAKIDAAGFIGARRVTLEAHLRHVVLLVTLIVVAYIYVRSESQLVSGN